MPSLYDEFGKSSNITARHVAHALTSMPSEKRGDFLLEIAAALDSDTQFYTSGLIRYIGNKYNSGESL